MTKKKSVGSKTYQAWDKPSTGEVTDWKKRRQPIGQDREKQIRGRIAELTKMANALLNDKGSLMPPDEISKIKTAFDKWKPHLDALGIMEKEKSYPRTWSPEHAMEIALYLRLFLSRMIAGGKLGFANETDRQLFCCVTMEVAEFRDVPLNAQQALNQLMYLEATGKLHPAPEATPVSWLKTPVL